jgi:hypothetical protein
MPNTQLKAGPHLIQLDLQRTTACLGLTHAPQLPHDTAGTAEAPDLI